MSCCPSCGARGPCERFAFSLGPCEDRLRLAPVYKCWGVYFRKILAGKKRHEVRKMRDDGFWPDLGSGILLRERSMPSGRFTGREIFAILGEGVDLSPIFGDPIARAREVWSADIYTVYVRDDPFGGWDLVRDDANRMPEPTS